MRFREAFRFEFEHLVRSPSTWVYGFLLCLVSGWFLVVTHEGNVIFNSPFRLTWMGASAGMFGLLVSAGLFGSVGVRDARAGLEPLLYTTPLRRLEYLGSRYLAPLAVNALLLIVIPMGQLAATLLFRRFFPEQVAPLSPAAYLRAFPLFLIPGLLFSTGILFAVAMWSRSVIPVYLAAFALFVSGIVAGNYAGRIDDPMLRALADPFSIEFLSDLRISWTPVEQNTRWIGLPIPLVVSRIAQVALAAGVLTLLHRTFRFGEAEVGGRRRRAELTSAPLSRRTVSVRIPRVAGTFSSSVRIRQMLEVTRRCLSEVTASRTFVVILVLAYGLTLLWGWNVASTVFDAPVRPVTQLVATVALSQRNIIIVWLAITLYTGEMVWKDRDSGLAEMTDAAPVSEGIALLGRYLAVLITLTLMQVVIMGAGMTIQALQGYTDFDIGLYLRILFGLYLVTYAIVAALAMLVHVVVNHKLVGHIAMFTVVLMWVSGGGLNHNLLIYGGDPAFTYSDMNGFGPFAAPLIWFRAYWAAWALLLGVVATLLCVRGREGGRLRRLRVAGQRLRGPAARVAAVAVALILLFGGFVFYNTNVLNDYRSPRKRGAPQAGYERRYGKYEGAPQPTITELQARVEIHPQERAADLSGTFRMVNLTGAPIDSVHVTVVPEMETRALSFDRPARAVVEDAELGFRIFALAQVLQPGDSLELTYDVGWRARGFRNDGIPTGIVASGSYFNRRWLPMIGYQPTLELSDDAERRRFGLPPEPVTVDSAALAIRGLARNEDRIRAEVTIGTAADQIAITPGVLKRTWTENGRRYFHYDTESAGLFGGTIIAGRYDVREDRWNDVDLRIYHHPEHTENLDRALHGMKAALEHLTREFGSLPYRTMSVVEIPPYGPFGVAHPGVISFAETYFHIRADEGRVDEPCYGVVHEVAHHWWGGHVRGATVPGSSFLSESLANYSAMLVTERVYGPDVTRLIYDEYMRRYMAGRAEQGNEVPVLDARGQPYISYRKGALAMWLLRDHIGEERVNEALRRYAGRFFDVEQPPYPTSRDLYAELRAVTPDSLHGLLTDLFETITLWNLRKERATVQPTAMGRYEVTLDVVASKVRADSGGRETEVPMDDLVEIGIFAAGGPDEPIYLGRHRIRNGPQTIRIIVGREPGRAGIDPRRRFFDRERNDNVIDVTSG